MRSSSPTMPDLMSEAPDQTRDLLERWHAGERAALEQLLERDLPWIRHRVRQRLGEALRQKLETQDLVQEAMVDALQYGPRFALDDLGAFRALMARIIENNIRDKRGWMQARRRAAEQEVALPRDTVLHLDAPRKEVTRVTQAVDKKQRAELVRLAMELLEPEDRQVVFLRQWEERPFEAVGEIMGLQANTARMRFQRALQKLAKKVEELRAGTESDAQAE